MIFRAKKKAGALSSVSVSDGKQIACRQSSDQLEHFGIFFGLRGCHTANAMFEISKDYYLMRIDTG